MAWKEVRLEAGRPAIKKGWWLQQCGWRQIAAFQKNLGHKTDKAWYRWWESQNHYHPGFWLTYSISFWGMLENLKKKKKKVQFCVHAQPLPLCPNLWDSTDSCPPGCSAHGILQTKILEWVTMASSRGSSPPRDRTWVSCPAGEFFTTKRPGKPKFSSTHIKFEKLMGHPIKDI